MNIVIVDNDIAVLRSLELALGEMGHQITLFSHPQEVLFHFVRTPRIDLLLSDYSMPEMNGDEMIERLRRDNTFHAQVMMMSAEDDLAQRIDLNKLKVDALFIKPLNINELKSRINAVV